MLLFKGVLNIANMFCLYPCVCIYLLFIFSKIFKETAENIQENYIYILYVYVPFCFSVRTLI